MVFISQQLIRADSDSVKELKHRASHITHALIIKIEIITELPPKLGLTIKGCAISVTYI